MAVDALTVLVVNAGSSSLQLSVLRGEEVLHDEELPSADEPDLTDRLERFLQGAPRIEAVGHRLVHGGDAFTGPTRLDDDTCRALQALAPKAPLHLPNALHLIELLRRRLPDIPHVGCFDTAFHADLPEPARTYALPAEWRERWGLRRYGFHGLSYAWATRRAAALLGKDVEDLSLVLTHLGGGASACAVRGGRSLDTTMGFTPLEGIVMGTRSGSVDPGLLLWLQTEQGLSPDEISDGLRHRSGLRGLSGGSHDTRELVPAAAGGDRAARLALDVFARSVRQHVAMMASALDRVDALVFTGEIGADQHEVRAQVCAGLATLGIDPTVPQEPMQDAVLSAPDSAVAVLLVVPREDRQIAREVASGSWR